MIVAYEDNMFKVKTDFGYVLVEKDKIAQILPNTPAQGDAAKGEAQPAAKPSTETQPKAEPAVASSSSATPGVTNASAKDIAPAGPSKRETSRRNCEQRQHQARDSHGQHRNNRYSWHRR